MIVLLNRLLVELEYETAAIMPIEPEPFFAMGSHTITEQVRKEVETSRNSYWLQMPILRCFCRRAVQINVGSLILRQRHQSTYSLIASQMQLF